MCADQTHRTKANGNPVRLTIKGKKLYFIPPGKAVVNLFHGPGSRGLTNQAIAEPALRYAFGCPEADIQLWKGIHSSGTHRGLGSLDTLQRRSGTGAQQRDLTTYLTGSSLDSMTRVFLRKLVKRLEAKPDDNVPPPRPHIPSRYPDAAGAPETMAQDENEHPDLYLFLRDDLFHAGMQSLCGDRFFDLSPSFCRDFWALDAHLPELFRDSLVPWWVSFPTGDWSGLKKKRGGERLRGRKRLLEAVMRWHQHVFVEEQHKEVVGEKRGEGGPREIEWDPTCGSRVMRESVQLYGNCGFSPQGKAALDMVTIWA